jgi:hypothetical protein
MSSEVVRLVDRAIAGARRLGISIPRPSPAECLSLRSGSVVEGLALYVQALTALMECAGVSDRSKPYAPGEPLPSGLLPEPGERWSTPAEIAAREVGDP